MAIQEGFNEWGSPLSPQENLGATAEALQEEISHLLIPPTERPATPMVHQLTIHGVDKLLPDPLVVHPAVRFWVIDGLTGKVIPPDPDCLPPSTLVGIQESLLDDAYYTSPFDLRTSRNLSPNWEESVRLNFDLRDVVKAFPEAIILFEMVDFNYENRQTVKRQPYQAKNNGVGYGRSFYPVWWGYLKLSGPGKLIGSNVKKERNRIRIQLFRAPQRRGMLSATLLRLRPKMLYTNFAVDIPTRVPVDDQPPHFLYETYADPINRLDVYPGTLTVSLTLRKRDWRGDRLVHRSMKRAHDLELRSLLDLCRRRLRAPEEEVVATSPKTGSEEPASTGQPLQFVDTSRKRTEECLVPCCLQASFRGGSRGCLALSFSHCGRYLAMAVCDEALIEVRVHDALYGPSPGEEEAPHAQLACPQLVSFQGHTDTVYTLQWAPDNSTILTCSADHTAKLWNVADALDGFSWDKYPTVESLAHANLRRVGCTRSTFIHPKQVYAGVYHSSGLVVFTGGFDEYIRCWSTSSGALLKSIKCTSNWIAHIAAEPAGSLLYVADGGGDIRIWRITGLVGRGVKNAPISRPERTLKLELCNAIGYFRARGISHVEIHAPEKQLYVWTTVDSCITAVDLSTYSQHTKRLQFRGPRFGSCPLRGAVSPDGSLLCSGSATGPLYFWSTANGEYTNHDSSGLDMEHSGPVYAAAWSPTDHRMAFATYSASLNLITIWYRPRPDTPVPTVLSSVRPTASTMGASTRRKPPAEKEQYEEPSGALGRKEWMQAVVKQWRERFAKRANRLMLSGVHVQVKDGAVWRPAVVRNWSTGSENCTVDFLDARGGSADVRPEDMKRVRDEGEEEIPQSPAFELHRPTPISFPPPLHPPTASSTQIAPSTGLVTASEDRTAPRFTIDQGEADVVQIGEITDSEGPTQPGSAWEGKIEKKRKKRREREKKKKKEKKEKKEKRGAADSGDDEG